LKVQEFISRRDASAIRLRYRLTSSSIYEFAA